MFVGESGVSRVIQRTCEMMNELKTDDPAELRAAGFAVEHAALEDGVPARQVEAAARARSAYAGLHLHGDDRQTDRDGRGPQHDQGEGYQHKPPVTACFIFDNLFGFLKLIFSRKHVTTALHITCEVACGHVLD